MHNSSTLPALAPELAATPTSLDGWVESLGDPTSNASPDIPSYYQHQPAPSTIRYSLPVGALNRAQRREKVQEAKALLRRAKADLRLTTGAATAQRLDHLRRSPNSPQIATYYRALVRQISKRSQS